LQGCRLSFTSNREFLIFDSVRWDVHDLSNLFRADWDRVQAPVSDPNLVVSPENSRPLLYDLVRAARHTIDVYAEEVADPGSEGELTRAARRGVTVRVVLAWRATPSGAHRLLRGRVAVRELSSPYVHAKLVLVDGREAFIGSENLSAPSLDSNREVGVLIRGGQLRQIETVFASDWRRALPVP
jgi:phosphatidylserine/phosphatidylglycerophosphate/cardiolipin synthase-like enzyme